MHRFALNTTSTAARSAARARHYTVLRSGYAACRHLSQGPPQTPKGSPSINTGAASLSANPPPELDNVVIPPQNFSKPTLSAIDFWYRFAKFSLIGLAVIVGGTAAALEGTHYWVEHYELASPSDPDGELSRWGWIKEAERWTGGDQGGTDPALTSKAAHALRSAWMTQHWGTGANILSANALANARHANQAIEARLEFSHDFLTVALALALATELEREGKPLRPETTSEILARKAATLERIGTKGALYDSRAAYERVWDTQPRLGAEIDELARLALKLGDINARLGDIDEARSWWARSLQLASSLDDPQTRPISDLIKSADSDPHIAVPTSLPSSPHAQRTVASVLSSLSAYYAQIGRLSDANAVQNSGVGLLLHFTPSKIRNQETPKLNSDSVPRTLHDLFMQHRLTLLALHRAEVSHALRTYSTAQTLEELAHAAIGAENVIHELYRPSNSSETQQKSLEDAQLAKAYTSSRTLSAPASSLLRDARRTALYAWTLSGILHENAASSPSTSSSKFTHASNASSHSPTTSLWKKIFSAAIPSSPPPASSESERVDAERLAAFRCYVRALGWAGVWMDDLESGKEPQPGKELLESEWRALWNGYERTREAVLEDVSLRWEKEKEKNEDKGKPR